MNDPLGINIEEIFTLSIETAARITGICRSRIYILIADGSIDAKKLGKSTLIDAASLRRFLADLPPAKSYTGFRPKNRSEKNRPSLAWMAVEGIFIWRNLPHIFSEVIAKVSTKIPNIFFIKFCSPFLVSRFSPPISTQIFSMISSPKNPAHFFHTNFPPSESLWKFSYLWFTGKTVEWAYAPTGQPNFPPRSWENFPIW